MTIQPWIDRAKVDGEDSGQHRVPRGDTVQLATQGEPWTDSKYAVQKLRDFEKEGPVSRKDLPGSTKHVEWILTPRGTEMLPLLMQLLVLGSKSNLSFKSDGKLPTLA